MTDFVALRATAYTYSIEDGNERRKAKATKKCIITHQFMFENYKDCFFNDKTY